VLQLASKNTFYFSTHFHLEWPLLLLTAIGSLWARGCFLLQDERHSYLHRSHRVCLLCLLCILCMYELCASVPLSTNRRRPLGRLFFVCACSLTFWPPIWTHCTLAFLPFSLLFIQLPQLIDIVVCHFHALSLFFPSPLLSSLRPR
jgi:hypothetical protein